MYEIESEKRNLYMLLITTKKFILHGAKRMEDFSFSFSGFLLVIYLKKINKLY